MRKPANNHANAAREAINRIVPCMLEADTNKENCQQSYAETGAGYLRVAALRFAVKSAAYDGVCRYALDVIRHAETGGTGYPKTGGKGRK